VTTLDESIAVLVREFRSPWTASCMNARVAPERTNSARITDGELARLRHMTQPGGARGGARALLPDDV